MIPFFFHTKDRDIRLMFEGMIKELLGQDAKLAVLIDPDRMYDPNIERLMDHLSLGLADIVLVGGSTSRVFLIDEVIKRIKARTSAPVLIFPGNALQISSFADGLLLPSLISGRNSDYLIGKHVESAQAIRQSKLPVIPMGYVLIDGGRVSTTAYVTQTYPIPSHLSELAADTALAGELLGLKCIYLEAGSGANTPVNTKMIRQVKSQISIPLIVGGGIRSTEQLISIKSSGADVVVIGSILEEKPEELLTFHQAWTSTVISS